MKNSEKIDINLEADSAAAKEEMTEEELCQEYYETALRYKNIAKNKDKIKLVGGEYRC